MTKTLAELLEAPEVSTPYPPLDVNRYNLKAVDARYTESYVRDMDGREMSPKVRLQLRVVDGDAEGRSAFVTVFVDQDGRTFGFVKRIYRKLAGAGLLDGFNTVAVTNDEIAQQFAVGVVGGEMEARLGIRVNNATGDQENILTRVY